MDIIAVWLINIVFFLQDCGMHYTGCPRRKGPNFGRVFLRSNYTDTSQACFIMQGPRLSVADNICLHFHFSVSRPGMGGV